MMNHCELTASITAAANVIACKFSDDELALLSTVLVQLGDTLATISANRSLCANIESKKDIKECR